MIFDKHNTKNDVNLLFEDMYGAYYDDDMKLHEDFTCNIIDKFTKEKKDHILLDRFY